MTITPASSVNTYGETQHSGSTTNYKAYVQKITGSQRTETSDAVAVEYMVYIPSTTYSASVDDLLTFGSITRVVVEVDIRADQFGQQAVVLALGAARRF